LDVASVEAARAPMESASAYAGPGGMAAMAISVVDIALWDAMGKTLGQSICRLLGGTRDRVPAYASNGMWQSLSVEALTAAAKGHVDRGFRDLKMRVGHEPRVEDDACRVRAVREAVGPEVRIMVDAATSWDEPRALAAGRVLQSEGVAWLEDPMPYQDPRGLAHLAADVEMPVAAGELYYTVEQFERMLDEGAADAVVIDLARIGGITPWMKVAAMAEARGVSVSGHVIPEAHVHLVAAAANGHLVEYLTRSNPILKSRLVLEDGHVLVPQEPGLGLELDQEACQRYRVS
jgi:L-alanine-DL-glutamate epimerase-like enolase superfamily enzyme